MVGGRRGGGGGGDPLLPGSGALLRKMDLRYGGSLSQFPFWRRAGCLDDLCVYSYAVPQYCSQIMCGQNLWSRLAGMVTSSPRGKKKGKISSSVAVSRASLRGKVDGMLVRPLNNFHVLVQING
jgi:hypothetical protein